MTFRIDGPSELEQALMCKSEVIAPIVGMWRWVWTLVLWWAILVIGVALAMLGPTLVEIAEQLGVPVLGAGSLFTWRASGYLIGAVWCGELLHRFPNAAFVFLVPLLIGCVGVYALPILGNYSIACAVFFFQGVPMGMFDTGGNVLMLDLWRDSPYQNGFEHAYHFFFGLGAAIAPQIVRVLLTWGVDVLKSWQAIAAGLFLTCVGLCVLGVFGPQYKPDGGADGDKERSSADSGVVLLTGMFLFVYVGIEVSFGGYIDVFSIRRLGESKLDGATLTGIYWGALCSGRLLASLVTPFVNHVRYLACHLLLAIVSISALGVSETLPVKDLAPGTSEYSLWVLCPTALFGFALAPLFPGAMLVVEELLGRALPPRDAGRIVGAAAAGEMSLPLLVGALFSLDPGSFCWSQLVLSTGAAVVFYMNSGSLLWARTVK